MVDLRYLTPDQKSLIIRENANYQFAYVNHQPINVDRINQELADKIGEVYNGSIMHSRILKMHTPLMQILKETNIDNISSEHIIPIIKDLIAYDYTMFLDLMTIFAVMLEAKDVEIKSNYIDLIIECSDNITALASSREKTTNIDESETQSIEETAQDVVEEETTIMNPEEE